MFNKFQSKKKWEEVLFYSENESKTFLVNNFMIPDGINFKKFDNNTKILRQGSDPMSKIPSITEPQEIIKDATPSIYYFKEPHERPSGFPVWFLATYPDICLWLTQNAELIKNIEPFKTYFNNEQKLIQNGKFSFDFLKSSINYYKNNVNEKLECQKLKP